MFRFHSDYPKRRAGVCVSTVSGRRPRQKSARSGTGQPNRGDSRRIGRGGGGGGRRFDPYVDSALIAMSPQAQKLWPGLNYAAFRNLYGLIRSSGGIFHALWIRSIISVVSARCRDRTSEARERDPRISASSLWVWPISAIA